jgi:hypothetical protein
MASMREPFTRPDPAVDPSLLAAFHESGHTCGFLVLPGADVRLVEVAIDRSGGGHTRVQTRRLDPHAHTVAVLAGATAELRCRYGDAWRPRVAAFTECRGTDRAAVQDLIGTDPILLLRLWDLAVTLVQVHERFIGQLAARLYRETRIEGPAIMALWRQM